MKTWNSLSSGLMLVAFIVGAAQTTQAATYDLNADWSDSSNPNGVWTYREGANSLPHVTAWQGLSGDFVTAQPAWARNATGSSNLPPWFKSSATVGIAHDWQTGDVVMHSTDGFNGIGSGEGNVIWTSPINGTATVSGNTWMGRDIGRGNHWALYNNGVLFTQGDIFSGDAYDRASPFNFANGSGGAVVLQNIPVTVGSVFELRITRTSGPGDYAGVNFTVTTVPEPSTALLVLSGLTALVATGRRKRA